MEFQLLEIKSPQQQMEVEKNVRRKREGETEREKNSRRREKRGSTGARQRWQAVKVAVTL